LGEQAGARSSTGIYGAPCVLWVGHLNRNKDPLTVLDGVSLVARQLPDLHLWCCYGNAPLLRAVSDRVSRDPALTDRVHLLGKVTHDDIQALMRAADMFVLGSHREGSGFSLIEALACGLVPVVTDIPSFRSLTGDGTIGRLWQCGNASQLASALLAMAGTASPNRRMLIRSHFDRHLSMAAVGRRLASAYRQSIDRHRARAG
jgi:glycosyltransferase involved in cell wall biosynthesis